MKKTGIPDGKKLKAENLLLRKEISRNALDLDKKNRELEIESALEKVRTIAMGMKAPEDMLEVCKTISLQLESLGVKDIRNVQTAIFYVQKGVYMNYEYYAKHKRTFITETIYTDHKIANAFALKMMKGKGQSYYTFIKGEKVKEWLKYQKGTNVFIDRFLEKATSLNYYWHSLGPVALGISTYAPLSKDDLGLFLRFLKVFELAYTRYLDIEQAIARAREARIEVSLEKIRAAAMAMNRAGDLLHICETLYREFQSLGFPALRNGMINIHNDEMGTFINYDYSDELGGSTNHLRYDIHPVIQKQIRQMRKADDAFSETVFEGKDLASWKKFRREIGEKDDTRIKRTKGLYYYFYSIGSGSIGISTFEPINDEKLQLLKRFRNVFHLSYQRYTDVKQAEEQAKEAQIELGLEKIRARAMAMQKSDELAELVDSVFRELTRLGFVLDRCLIMIYDKNSKGSTWWLSSEQGAAGMKGLYVDYHPNEVYELYLKKWKERKEKWQYILEGRIKKNWDNYIFKYTELSFLPDAVKRAMRSLQRIYLNVSFNSFGSLTFSSFEPLGENEFDILLRFAKVFDQTYTRFLDLQKAEAQAKEARIEAALERTRTQSMIMQHSNELDATLRVFHEQILLLGIPSAFSFLWLPDEENDRHLFWAAWVENVRKAKKTTTIFNSKAINYPLDRMEPATAQCLIDWKGNESVVSYNVPPAGVKSYFAAWQELIAGVEELKPEYFSQGLYYVEAFIKYGCFGVMVRRELTEQEKKILYRFAIEFERTYTRFLDLQKAEAQAREARIEAALERIRARALAMHNSEELIEVARVLREQMSLLGQPELETSAVQLYEEDPENIISFRAFRLSADKEGEVFYRRSLIPKNCCVFIKEMLQKFYAEEMEYTVEVSGKKQADWYKEFFKIAPEVKIAMEKNNSLHEKRYYHFSKFSGGALLMAASELPSVETCYLQKRAAKVFDLAYQRFLDLKKAEAQAREAKTETALERIRSRTMGMQKSDELKDVIQLVYEQFLQLNIHIGHAGFVIDYKAREDYDIWVADPIGSVPSRVIVPYFDSVYYNQFNEAKRKGENFFPTLLSFEEKNNFYKKLFEYIPGLPEEARDFYFNCPGLAASTVLLEDIGLYIENFEAIPYTEEENAILMRFGKVFQQTYTRFNDLKKAELQAREAQIQLALERVRAKTMAMQKSDELNETSLVLYQQLEYLGEPVDQITIGIVNEMQHVMEVSATVLGSSLRQTFMHSIDEPIVMNRVYKGWKAGQKSFVLEIDADELRAYNEYRNKLVGFEKFETGLEHAGRRIIYVAYFSKGMLALATHEPRPDESMQLLVRFASAFDLTYTRFLDLQKAEEQAREANIEAALERVRSRTMAMHNSQDVGDTVHTIFAELLKLGVTTNRCGILIHGINHISEVWTARANAEGTSNLIIGQLDMMMHPMLKAARKAWENKEPVFQYQLIGDDLKEYYRAINNSAYYPTKFNPDALPSKEFHTDFYFSEGSIFAFTNEPVTPEAGAIFKRFAAVFGQTYRRYLDLQKAEAQAREGQIQLALERVRARTMAMQRSEELFETAQVLFEQFKALGEDPLQITIGIVNEEKGEIEFNVTDWSGGGSKVDRSFAASIEEPTLINKIYRGWKEQKKSVVVDLTGKELEKWIKYRNEISKVKIQSKDTAGRRVVTVAFFSKGHVSFSSPEPRPLENVQLLERFAAVFDLTYTRFLDLKNAEAQAREAKIETALEKVRSRTMAMQKSDELADTVWILFEQLKDLGEQPERAFIGVINEVEHVIEIWATQHGGLLYNKAWKATIDEPYVMNPMYKAWKKQKKSLVIDLKGESLEGYFQFLKKLGAPVKREIFGERRFENIAFFSRGMLGIITPEEQTPEALQLYERFASVFDLTYTRFLDLKNAEEQAREARIETSLERVRGKAMAMHSSKDLSETVNLFFGELKTLGITPIRCGVGAIDEKERTSSISAASAQQQGESYELIGKLKLEGHPVLDNVFRHWKDQKEYFPVLKGKEITEYYKVMKPQVAFPDYPEEATQFGCYFHFREGIVFAWSEKEFTEDELRIFRRFTTVISLTYRRYIELQKSEAQAREAVKQASLDRIRAEIASMRTIDDLERITPLIWKELTILGVPFIRCGVFIMDNEQSLMHTFLSTPEGKAIAAFHLPYDTPGNVSQILHNWQQKKIYTDHWNEAAFLEWSEILVQKGAITAQNNYLASFPEGGFFLHFVPFLQGMLYAGNSAELSRSDIKLLQTVADAFSTAYARYEDFNRLEVAKQQVENTLTDLKQAQQQLVQSEKMASLGELTAGIAHEIQNPLNFVNNFSEVSKELLDEMRTEIDSGNLEEAKEIANDVIQNLEKINHHGKRADSIVKGMLQHSRSSSGQKELTDLNALCDEYLRLSFHGLRAKDKTFNASFNTELDDEIPKVSIIPQDIGRVILNLINNAFYAVSEKRKQAIAGYEPTVTVATKRNGDKAEIRVSDNGMGIPQRSLTKIFQPFYTTKPTGQGTGLGLSLSYDIITKGHNGEIKVDTKEGEGTTFTILIPNQ